MNHSIYTADRTTHLKIVVVGLLGAILIAGAGIAAHVTAEKGMLYAKANGPAWQAGKPMTLSVREGTPTVR